MHFESYNRSKSESSGLFTRPNYTIHECRSKTEIPCRRAVLDERRTISNNSDFPRWNTFYDLYLYRARVVGEDAKTVLFVRKCLSSDGLLPN